jgi:hypothetical protein
MGRNTLIIFYSLIFFLLLTTFAVGADKIARVLEKDGRVTLTREQRSIQISRGEWLYKKDKIRTGKKSSVELKLVDGSLVNIGELGDVSLLDLVFDPIKKDGFIDLKIATGAFRMISGNKS